MDSLQFTIQEYSKELKKGHIQKAYKGIINFMSDLRTCFSNLDPDYTVGALYYGYMDMTYFACTPPALKNRKLKIAIVYLHEECRFEVWLAGNNRQVQAEYCERLGRTNLGKYNLSQISPGVDSIIAAPVVEQPDFDNLDALMKQIREKTEEFNEDISKILEQ